MNSELIKKHTFERRLLTLYQSGHLPFSHHITENYRRGMSSFETDWWGVYSIRIEWDMNEPFKGIQVSVIGEKDSSKTSTRNIIEISSGPGVDFFDFVVIDPWSFHYITKTARSARSGQERNARVPVDSVAIVEGFVEWQQEYGVRYFRVHHSGLVPISKGEAIDSLVSQLVMITEMKKPFQLLKLDRVNADGSMVFRHSGSPSFASEDDFFERNGEWVYKYEDEYTFRLRITPDMLDDRTRPWFKEFVDEHS